MATAQPPRPTPTPHKSTRSKRWVWPLLVVLVWLFIGGPLASFSGKLAEVQENDNAAFLPKTAESTRALNTLLEFQEVETTPVTVVIERRGGLTEADQTTLSSYAEEIGRIDGVVPQAAGPPLLSEDGESAQLVVQLGVSDGEEILAAVNSIRDVTQAPPDGLTVLVGGQGGILADFVNAFGAIDGIGATIVDFWRMREYRDWGLWDPDRMHMGPAGHQRMAAAVLDTLEVPHALLPVTPRELPRLSRREALADHADWVRTSAAPWVHRRITGRSSGDGILPRHPEWFRPLTSADASPSST